MAPGLGTLGASGEMKYNNQAPKARNPGYFGL